MHLSWSAVHNNRPRHRTFAARSHPNSQADIGQHHARRQLERQRQHRAEHNHQRCQLRHQLARQLQLPAPPTVVGRLVAPVAPAGLDHDIAALLLHGCLVDVRQRAALAQDQDFEVLLVPRLLLDFLEVRHS